MEIEEYFTKKKELYDSFMNFIEATGDLDDEFNKFNKFTDFLKKGSILTDKQQIHELLEIISSIEHSYRRTPEFSNKLDKIFHFLFQDQRLQIKSTEIYEIFSASKNIIYHLLETKVLKIDEIFNKFYRDEKSRTFFYPIIKSTFDEKDFYRILIEEEISKTGEDLTNFEAKCQKGENDSYICTLIREDSIEDLISYINQNNISLTSTINPSIFERNTFLIGKNPTLIQYAAFFGSIQAINYFRFNKVALDLSVFIYAIHSRNAELIQLFEDENIINDNYDELINEAIKCHHNEIADYFADKAGYESVENNFDIFGKSIVSSKNYSYLPNDIKQFISQNKDSFSFKISDLPFQFKTITIPSSINEIGSFCFCGCSSLTQITIPSNVTSIGDNVFSDCSSLTQITIPSSVISIGEGAFNGCSSLTQFTIPSSVKKIENYTFCVCSSLTQIIIPSNVTSIGDCAFRRCSKLTQITIPSSVTSIENGAFSGCSSLTQITIPSSVTSIESYVFNGCSKLTQIPIPSSVTSIKDSAFSGCSLLTQITIPSSVTSIGNNVFEGCSSLTQIIIPSSVTSIGNYAFSECSSLTQIIIPSSVNKIGDSTFYGCSSLKQITIPSSVKMIDINAFEECTSLTQIIFDTPSSVTSIGDSAFLGCLSLKQITIPSSVTTTGFNVFENCPKLTQITIPSSLIDTLGLNKNTKIVKI